MIFRVLNTKDYLSIVRVNTGLSIILANSFGGNELNGIGEVVWVTQALVLDHSVLR